MAGVPYGGQPIECWESSDGQHLTCSDGYDMYNVESGDYIYKLVVIASTGFSGKILLPVAIAKWLPYLGIKPVVLGVVVNVVRSR